MSLTLWASDRWSFSSDWTSLCKTFAFLTYSRDNGANSMNIRNLKCWLMTSKLWMMCAERGVRLMEEFKDVLTDDEEQRRMLLHCAEDTRKLYPDFRKSTLAKTHWTFIIPTVIVLFMTCRKRALSGIKQRNLNDGQHLDVVFML